MNAVEVHICQSFGRFSNNCNPDKGPGLRKRTFSYIHPFQIDSMTSLQVCFDLFDKFCQVSKEKFLMNIKQAHIASKYMQVCQKIKQIQIQIQLPVKEKLCYISRNETIAVL